MSKAKKLRPGELYEAPFGHDLVSNDRFFTFINREASDFFLMRKGKK